MDRIRQLLVFVGMIVYWVTAFGFGGTVAAGNPAGTPYFLPAAFTFAVWGLIYTSGAVYAVYQLLPAQRKRELHRRIGWFAAATYWLTGVWLVFSTLAGQPNQPNFEPRWILGTVVVLVGMLVGMTRIYVVLRKRDAELTRTDRWTVQLAHTSFFAWLTVAAIANTTAYLFAINWTGGLAGEVWATLLLVVAIVLGSGLVLYSRPSIGTLTYAGVFIWASFGLFAANSGRSVPMTVTSLAAMVIITALTAFHFYKNRSSASKPNRGKQLPAAA